MNPFLPQFSLNPSINPSQVPFPPAKAIFVAVDVLLAVRPFFLADPLNPVR